MKNLLYIFITTILFISCSKKKSEEGFDLQKIIDVDNNGNYEEYFKSLSDIYLDFLKDENNTSDSKIVYDSILNEKKELNKLIVNGDLELKNHIIDSFTTSDKKIKIYKLRSHLLDVKSKTELIKEKIILLTSNNKIIPYPTKSNPKFDSILKEKTNQNILKEIEQSSIYREYNNTDINFQQAKKRFREYTKLYKSNDIKFLEYIYPPVIQKISSNKSGFNSKQKKLFLENLKKSKNQQELDFKEFLIDDFYKLECYKEGDVYILEYLIDVNNNTYIPGKTIVFNKNNMIYFMEIDIQEIEEYYDEIFSKEFINCISQNALKNK